MNYQRKDPLDYQDIAKNLKEPAWYDLEDPGVTLTDDGATAILELLEKNEQLEKQLAEVFGDIHRIQLIYGIENWEAAAALERLCEKYCAQSGNHCFAEGENHICKNFEWRGKGEKKA